ncbi:MAG: choice-of-anchor A family protein, partial [Ignavibacteria bacterium]|nr:choice-of-anchor A family protein [Ignavibacteria bacterium]
YVCPPPAPKQADVKITKSASSLNPSYGDNQTYTVRVSNSGPGDAKGVQVSELLPAAVIYVSHSTTQGVYDRQTGLWTVGNLSRDQEATLTVNVKIDGSQVNNTAFDLGSAKDYNLFVLQDASQPSSDTQGKAAIGRDAAFGNYSIGDQLAPESGDVLIVGRNLTFTSGRVYNGNAVYGGSTNLPLSSVSVDGKLRMDAPVNFASAKSYLENLSTTLSSYAINGNTKFEWGGLFLSGTDPFLNVFSIDGSNLSQANNFQIDVPNGSVVLINISGQNLSWTGGLTVNGTSISNVLYNFYQATDLSIKGIDIKGSVLAPWANVNFISGVENGQMICKALTGQGQFNNSKFIGNIPYDRKITNIATVSTSITTDPVPENNSSSVTVTLAGSTSNGGNTGSNEGNTTWQEVSSFTQGEIIYSMLYNGTSIYAGTVGGKIYQSTDNGLCWARINADMNAGWIWALCLNNGQLFAATEKGVYKFTGKEWTLTSLSGKDVHALAAFNGSLVAGTWGQGIFRSTDNALNWTEFNDGLGDFKVIQSLVADDKGNLFAGSVGGGIFKMHSGESKWYKHEVGNNIVWSLGQSQGTLYAGLYSDGLYRSTDEGANWEKASTLNLPFVYSIVSDNNDNVYLSSWSGGVYVISSNESSARSLGMEGSGVSSIVISGNGENVFAGTKDGKIYVKTAVSSATGVDKTSSAPEEFSLLQNFPNPFNPSTMIKFNIAKEGHYTLKVFDVLGKEVATLINDNLKAGRFSLEFNAKNLASGIYIYQLRGFNLNQVRKMLILR